MITDAHAVWNMWRRILTDDRLVDAVLARRDVSAGGIVDLTSDEMAILASYASTREATNTNISMYRQGLVRNALAALTLVPLTQRLLYASDLDVEAVAARFVESIGYRDDGPHFWRCAGDFVAYVATLPEFAAGWRQDVVALEAAVAALARRLGTSTVDLWPERVAETFTDAVTHAGLVDRRLVASRAAAVVISRFDLTPWLENPEEFDADQVLEPSTRHWLIWFPSADAAHTYAELSDRASRVFGALAQPAIAADVSAALADTASTEVLEVIRSLVELGVVVGEAHL